MNRTVFFLLCASCLALSACEGAGAESRAPHVFAEYFIRYLEEERQLKAHAAFFEGDSLQAAQPKVIAGGVALQNIAMSRRDLGGRGIRYTLDRSADYEPPYRFSYRDDRGLFREHLIDMSPIANFFIKGQISKSLGMAIVVEGGLLKHGESLLLLFTDAEQMATSISIGGPTSTIEYALPPHALANLNPGPGWLYLVKKQSATIQGQTQTTFSAIEYYSRTINIEVLP
jgi:hypothetical protein